MKAKWEFAEAIMRSFGRLSLKRLKAVYKLIGMLEDDERGEILFELEKFFRRDICWCKISIWKTIQVVVYKSAEEVRSAIAAKGCILHEFASDMLDAISFEDVHEERISLVKMTVWEITGKDRVKLPEIIAGIKRMGGEICPANLGYNLCLQITEAVEESHGPANIAMNPVCDRHKRLCIFSITQQYYVEQDRCGRWLAAAKADYDYPGDSEFVFIAHPG